MITMEELQRKESLHVMKSCLLKKKSVCVSVCEKAWKKSAVHVIIGQRPDRGHTGQAADGRRERDIYLELHLSRLWGGYCIVRYCSRAWQGQEGTREGDKGRWVGSRDTGWPRGRGGYPHGGPARGRRVGIGRFSRGADAQYADV